MPALRPVGPEDEHLLLGWRNEASTRAASFGSNEISPEEHHRWFADKLRDPGCALFIVEEGGEPVGQVRLDLRGDGEAEISIGLAPEARGRGIGRESLRQALLEAPRALGVSRLTALVKRENEASLAAFASVGFVVVGGDGDVVQLLQDSEVDPPSG